LLWRRKKQEKKAPDGGAARRSIVRPRTAAQRFAPTSSCSQPKKDAMMATLDRSIAPSHHFAPPHALANQQHPKKKQKKNKKNGSCDHLGDPIAGCGLATTSLMLEAVNTAVGPDVGVYSVAVDADKKTCSIEADMPNEGGSTGGCRLLGGMAYAVVQCPVGRVPVGLACVAVDDENQSTPVKGTTQATLLHTAQCGFPFPFPPPFGGARAAIIMACQPVEVQGSDLMRRRGGSADGGAGAGGAAGVTRAPFPASVEELLKKAGTGPEARRARAAAAAAAAEAAKQQQKAAEVVKVPKVAEVVAVTPTPAPAPAVVAAVSLPAKAAAATTTTTKAG
jgi:hypothetical protein